MTDLDKYKKAWAEGDVDTLELCRANNPQDARYNLHLAVADIDPKKAQGFEEVNKNHKDLVSRLGLYGAPNFMKLLNEGKYSKLKAYVRELPDDTPLKSSMEVLLRYL